MEDVLKRIYDYTLEDIMGDCFGRYAKEIIQDRAIPDVRDGLKPVQRRILYTMYQGHNTFDKPYRKSAKTVGDVMGMFHPHGDSSIYEAIVRMSQWWKQNAIYIDMHGNNGSMDGDSPAAYRYTEARLSKISNELLKDIYKDTVKMTYNYDDTLLEPTVLPAKYPNILVNGGTGISAGYAANIPHNLSEIIDATIKRIDSPNCRLDTILEIVKGPDFPTGGVACGKQGIIDAFTTGRGKVVVKSKYEIVKNKGKDQIIITKIPFEVNKGLLVKKIDEIRIDKKIDGITEVRDESDLNNPETIVIDLKKDANIDLIVNYLLKNTEMQINYNYNMVAIVNRRPETLGIIAILDAYIEHQKEVITKRTEFDLKHALARIHIVEGLIKAISILDEVIKTIRSSKNKVDAKENLVKEYSFTELQAEAIVMLQLYKLTNTDVTELIDENKKLELEVIDYKEILSDDNKLKGVMKDELREIKKNYGIPRKTVIEDEVSEIKIDTTELIAKEDCVVVVTHEGYVKRVSLRSYNKDEETLLKESDYVIGLYQMNTMDTLLLFTDLGNYLYIPIYELPDLKWKELGKHVSNIVKINDSENIIYSIPTSDFNGIVTITTKNGFIKRTLLSEFKVTRYSKPIKCIGLKDNDKVIDVTNLDGECIFITTKKGYGLRYKLSEVSTIGIKASGVKAINLKDDFVVSVNIINNDEYLTIITSNGTGKRVKLSEFDILSRARKGVLLVRDVKTNPYSILKTFVNHKNIGIVIDKDIESIKVTELPIVDRYSTGSVISKKGIKDCFIINDLVKLDEVVEKIVEKEVKEEVKDVNLEHVDEVILTIDDMLRDLEIEDL